MDCRQCERENCEEFMVVSPTHSLISPYWVETKSKNLVNAGQALVLQSQAQVNKVKAVLEQSRVDLKFSLQTASSVLTVTAY
jgi:hypothetical protein